MVAELTALRDQIDEVDKELLNLLAKRLELVAEVGEVKAALDCLFMFRSVRHLCWPRGVQRRKHSACRQI